MKVKTSITLSEDLMEEIDRLARGHKNRSAFLEKTLSAAIRQMMRERENARDLEILNRHADALSREAHDVLDYQSPL